MRTWNRMSWRRACSALVVCAAAPIASAGVIVSPTGATIDAGGPGFGSIGDTFNQSGLSAGFTSGVTDYDAYLAGGPSHTLVFSGFEWFSEIGTGDSTIVTYDLGSIMTIDRLALWNEETSGIGELDLASSTDGVTFSTFATGLLPTDNPLADYLADSFAFGPVLTRYVRFTITDSPQPIPGSFDSAAIGEVAFRVASSVPLPSSAFMGLGLLGGLGIALRLRKRKAVTIA